jgi:hypothetical protein
VVVRVLLNCLVLPNVVRHSRSEKRASSACIKGQRAERKKVRAESREQGRRQRNPSREQAL